VLGSRARPAGEGWVAVVDDAAATVDAVVALVRGGGLRIGVGAAPPGPDDAPVTLAARRALEAAGRRPARLAVRGTDPEAAADAQAVLTALAVLLARRSAAAWAAVDLLAAGATRAAAAAALGVSRQAVAQRLAAASWDLERELRPTAARLLDRAAGRRPG
jgi:DNA-binding LacI/PurR family transcriptional regulator